MNNLKINISNLNDGEHIFEFKASPEEFDFHKDDLELVDEVITIASLYKTGNEISVNINLQGKFRLICDRCLEDYEFNFNNKFEIIYKFDFTGIKIKDNDENDDIKFISPNTKFIDLKNDIRDYILLSIPMKKAPAEKDGICLYCNNDTYEMLNIKREEAVNPVWEKLLKTKTK